MSETFRVLAVLAHPDDESMGLGGLLRKLADDGVATSLICATLGQRGWKGPAEARPSPEGIGEIRREELRAAAAVLGLSQVEMLGYMDGELDRVAVDEVVGRIAARIREIRPHVVVTFGPEGAYGHPDHVAISQFATAAVVQAAGPGPAGEPPHRVAKLYYLISTEREVQAWRNWWGDIRKEVNGQLRGFFGYADWVPTTRIDVAAQLGAMWQAVSCHRSQLPGDLAFEDLPAEVRDVLQEATLYRAYSCVNGGREVETDLLAGLR